MGRMRGIAFLAFVFSSSLIYGVVAVPFLLFGENAARAIAKLWTRMALGALKYITGITYRVEGAENIPDGGAIVAANHQSMWETLALYHLLPRPVFVFKKELARLPIYGWVVACAGNIAVDRKGGAKTLRAMRAAAAKRIEEGCQVIVFPEGTRVPTGQTAKFHSGIAGIYAAVGAPCVPAAHNSGLFWRHPGPDKIPGEITIRFLPAIAPGLDRKTFLNQLKQAIDSARPDLADTPSTETNPSND